MSGADLEEPMVVRTAGWRLRGSVPGSRKEQMWSEGEAKGVTVPVGD